MRRNIELKARLSDPAAAQAIAERLSGQSVEIQRQTDTYFNCSHGRLKLREIEGRDAQLIWYNRPDLAKPKGSDYLLTPVPDAAALRQTLSQALGTRGIVRKIRRVYLYHNVRIHLDEVDGVGSFLEFEAVLDDRTDDAAGQGQVDDLQRRFAVSPSDLLSGSYSDMLVPPRR